MSGQNIEVALRVQAQLEEARKQVQGLKGDMQDLGRAGKQASADVGSVGPSASSGGASAASAASAQQRAQASTQAATAADREKVAIDRLMESLDPAASNAQRLAGAQNELNAALSKGLITQEQHTRMMALAQQRYAGLGVSAGQTAAAMRMLPAQITDITTSLASGMPVWLVAIQQGGQIKDSFGGIGPAARAMTAAITPAGAAIAGLAAVAAGVGTAMVKAEQDAMAFNVAIQTTGNAAGATQGRIEDLAREAEKVSGISQRAAEQAAIAMVQSGRLGMEVIGNLTKSINGYAAATRTSTDAAASSLAKLFTDPAKAAKQLDEQFNFLSAAQRRHIALLMEQGRSEQAQLELSRLAADHFGRVVPENLGYLQAAWKKVGDAASWTWAAMLGAGREDSLDQQIKKQKGAIESLEALMRRRGDRLGDLPRRMTEAQAELASLMAKQQAETKAADESAAGATKKNRVKQLRDQFDAESKAFATGAQQIAKAKKDLDELLAVGPEAGGISQSEYEQRLKAVTERANRGTAKGDTAAQVLVQKIKSDLALLQATIRDSDALVVKALEEGRATLDDAYAKRLASLRDDSAAQRKALEAEAGAGDTTKARKIEIKAQISLLGSSLTTAERELQEWRRAEELKLADLTVRLRVDTSALTGQFDRSAIEQQLRQRYAEDVRAAGRVSDPAEAQAARQRIELLIQAGAAQDEFNNKLTEAQRLQSQIGVLEQGLRTQADKGLISQTEAEARINQARAAQVPLLQAIAVELERIRAALPPEVAAALDAMSVSIGNLRNETAAATPVLVDMGTKLKNTAIDGLADAAANAAANFGSLRDMATSTLRQIAADILRSDIKRLLTNLFTPSSSGGGGSGSGSWVGAAFSAAGKFFGFAEGGHIRGPGTGTSDSIPALVDGVRPIAVSNNEFIHPERAVQHYGLPFMEAVRTLRLPKPQFQFGGLVAASQKARFATGGQVTGGAGGAMAQAQVPNVQMQFINNGTPHKVVSQDTSYNGRDLVVKVVLADLQTNGPMTRGIQNAMNRN